MKWNKITLEIREEVEDIVISTLADIGLEGAEIQDKQPLSEQDKKQMFVDILPDMPEDDGVAYLNFYLDEDEDVNAMLEKVKAAGFDTYMIQVDGMYKIQVGAYSKKENADAMANKLKAAGFDTFITTHGGQAVSTTSTPTREVTIGSAVRLKKGAKTYSGGSLASFVYERNHQVTQLSGDRAVISYKGTVVAAVHKDDLILV